MRVLIISFFLLFPSLVFGEVGDVYYCSMKSLVKIKGSEVKKYQTQKFKFKRLEDKILFSNPKGNYFSDFQLTDKHYSTGEMFSFTDKIKNHNLKYNDGNFNISSTGYEDMVLITGTCSIF